MADRDVTNAGIEGFQPCDVRQSWHVPHSRVMTYGTDNSETILYRFNALGFRGEDHDPAATFHICVIGESNAFGVGIPEEATFGYRLKVHVAEALGLDIAQVNLLNMGVSGASADYCVRSAFRQLAGQNIDLAICHLPSLQRREYYDGDRYRSLVVPGEELTDERLAAMPAPLVGFCEMYTPQLGQIDYVKNMLLLQSFLKAQRIPFLLSSQFLARNKGKRPHLWPFYRHLDPVNLHHHRWFTVKPDLAADGRHAGVRSHAACAISLLHSYVKLCAAVDDGGAAPQLRAKLRDLKLNDPDWAYCNQVVQDGRKSKRMDPQVDDDD